MESSPASSLLHPPCFAIATTPLADAFSCLDEENSAGCVLVMDHDRLVGMVTASDMVRCLAKGRSPNTTLLADVMSHPVITLQQTELTDPSIAIERLHYHHIRYLPVLDGDRIVGVVTGDRIQQYSEFRQSVAQFRSTFEQVAVGISHVSLDGQFLRVNQRLCMMLGYSESELLQLTFQAITHPDDLEIDLDNVHRLLQGDIQTYTLEKRYICKDGQYIWINLTVSLVRSPTGQPHYFISVIEDINERKQTEEALRKSEAMNRAILQAIPDLLIRVDREGRHVEMLHGESVKEVLEPAQTQDEYTFFDVLPPNLAACRAAAIQKARETQSLQIYEQEIILNGEACWEEVRVIPLNSEEVLVMIRDITDRKQAEHLLHQLNQDLERRVAERTQALQESEERWQLALQSYEAGIWDRDFRDDVTFRSRRWKEIRGLDDNEVGTGWREWSDRIHPDDRDRVLTAFEDYVTRKAPVYREEYRVYHKHDYYVWIRDQGQALWDEKGNIVRMVGAEIDITERKRSEDEAQCLREQLQSILSTSPVIIYTCNPKAVYEATFVSENVVDLLGYTAEEWLADTEFWTRCLHPEDASKILQKEKPLLETGRFVCEYRFLNKNGDYRWILDEQRLIYSEQGELVNIVGYMADISDRKQTDLLLQSQKQFLRQLIDTIPHLIFVKDRESRFVLANRAIADFYGTTVKALIGNTSDLFNPNPDEVEQFRIADYAVIESGTSCVVEDVITSAQGDQGYFQTVKVPIRSLDGQSWNVLGIATNITLRKRIEDQLRESEAHLSAAQRIAKLGSWEFNLQNQTIRWSEQTYKIFGRDPSEGDLTYEEFRTYVHPEDWDVLDQTTQIITESQEPFELEYRACCPNGQIRYILSRADLVMDSHGQPSKLLGTVLDISDRRKAEIQLQEINERLALTNAELDRATRLKDEFLANMSHELRTPLNAILGMTEGLQDEVFGALSDRQKRPIEMIERSGKHLLALINDILDLSKIEAGKLELQRSPTSAKYLCDSSLMFVRQQAVKKEITLHLEIPPNLPNIRVDELRIRQVLINLLSNAVKFTPDGGNVTLSATTEVQNGQRFLRFSVTDTGIGIANDDLEKLFQPFVQLDSDLNRQQTGTGLGLALVRRLVALHDGITTVTSTPDTGSCFTVWLPYTPAEEVDCGVPLPTSPRSLSTHNRTVLVIDDSATASEQITRYLEAAGMEATVYAQGEGVIDLVLELQPGLIILDILLPHKSGWEVLKELKAHPKTQSIPVIIVSVVDERSRGLSLGAAEYLVKPISQDEFRATLQKLTFPNPILPRSNPKETCDPPGVEPESVLILLAEDNEMNGITISSYLSTRGYRLITAQNGEEAIAQAQTHRPDLILMDVQMPGMDGLEATRRLRAHAKTANIPIIMLTALTMPGDRDRCLEAGANHYLSKPVRLKELMEIIPKILQKTYK